LISLNVWAFAAAMGGASETTTGSVTATWRRQPMCQF
jgi:hypothetical protein